MIASNFINDIYGETDIYNCKYTQIIKESKFNIINAGDIIFLYGEIGVGKTTLVRFIVNHLESKNGIQNSEVLISYL